MKFKLLSGKKEAEVMKRHLLHIAFGLFATISLAQNNSTVLNEVILSQDKSALAEVGHTEKGLTDTLVPGTFLAGLDKVIAANNSTHVRSYGPGLSSTYSSRGSSSGQVGVYYHDLPLNSPGLGSTDLSLLPTQFFSGTLVNGGNSALFGSQAMGSVINLEEKNNRSPHVKLGFGLGSFGNYSGLADVALGRGNFKSNTLIKYSYGKNNFDYSYRNQNRERKNSAVDMLNFSQNFKWFSNNRRLILEAGVWGVTAKRQSPNSILSGADPVAKLDDDQLKMYISGFYVVNDKASVKITQGLLVENQRYRDANSGLDDYNDSKNYITKIIYKYSLNSKVFFSLGGDYTLSQMSGSSKQNANQDNLGMFGMLGYKGNRAKVQVTARQELLNGKLVPFSPSLAYEYKIYSRFAWVGNVGYNYRYPTLNDKYWQPGGNPDLNPEKGWSGETGFKWTNTILEIKMVYYDGLIRDYIQWVPANSGVWSPQNIKSIRNQGAEIYASYKAKFKNMKVFVFGGYTYTNAYVKESRLQNDKSVGNQIIYTPRHKFSGNLSAAYKRFSLVYLGVYTSSTEANSDHAKVGHIDAFLLHNISLHYGLKIGHSHLKTHVAVNNLTNISYQTIKYYPMPGINFELGFTINI